MEHLEAFLGYLRNNRRFTEHTIIAYRNDLLRFAEYLEQNDLLLSPNEIHRHLVRHWLIGMMEAELARSTIARRVSALRSFFRYLQREGLSVQNPAAQVQIPKQGKRLVQAVSEKDLNHLLDQIEIGDDLWSQAKGLILEFFYATGMRQGELIALRSEDFDFSEAQVRVLGKGNKERLLPLPKGLVQRLDLWYRKSNVEFGPARAQTFFVGPKGAKLYPRLVYKVINDYFQLLAGVEKRSPHVLRHSFATHLLNRGADLQTIKDLLGHASLAATQVYTHNSIEQLKAMYNQTHPKGR